MRHNVIVSLSKEISIFKESVVAHIRPILQQDNDLTHLTHYFSQSGQMLTMKHHLKWNFEEFKVKHPCEKSMFKIWMYYLKILVQDDEKDG